MKRLSWLNGMTIGGIAALFAALLCAPALRHPPHSAASLFQRISTALENYAVDNNGQYPPAPITELFLPNALTTPVPYLSAQDLIDPFALINAPSKRIRYLNIEQQYGDPNAPGHVAYDTYKALHGSWLIWSGVFTRNPTSGIFWDPLPYDPTNGAISQGTIFRSQRLNSETGEKAD